MSGRHRAGNGGLTAAATMAKAGKKVLLVEQHNLPGGIATSFVRGRFEFEPSLHELCDVGSRRTPARCAVCCSRRSYFRRLGGGAEAYRLLTIAEGKDNLDIVMPFGVKDTSTRWKRTCPQPSSMEKFIKLCEGIMALCLHWRFRGKADSRSL